MQIHLKWQCNPNDGNRHGISQLLKKRRWASCNNKMLKYKKEAIKSYFTTIHNMTLIFLVLIYSTKVSITFVRVELMILLVIHQDIKLLFSIMLVLIENSFCKQFIFINTPSHPVDGL